MIRPSPWFIVSMVAISISIAAIVITIISAINLQRHSDAEDAFLRDIYNHSRTDSQLIADGKAVCEKLDSGMSYGDVLFNSAKPDGMSSLVDLTSAAVHNLCPEHIAAENVYVGR